MSKKELTFEQYIEPIRDYVDWGSISEDLWDGSYRFYEGLKGDNFTQEDRGRLSEALRDLAGRILLVAEDINKE